MENVADLVASMRKRGVMFWMDHGQLRCRAPQGALTAEQTVLIRKIKGEIISTLFGSQSPPLVPRSFSGPTPLTFQQEWLWTLLQKYKRFNCVMTYSLRLSGELNVEFLRRSLEELVRRHESLRTRIILVDGAPRQQIDPPAEFRLKIVDLAAVVPGGDVDVEARCFAEVFLSRWLDLTGGALFHVQLLKLSAHEHALAIALHHIISDGTSVTVFFRELWSLYGDFVRGHPSLSPEESLHYADYAVWQRNAHCHWLQKHAGYWKRRLAGAAPIRWPRDEGVDKSNPHTLGEFEMSFGEVLSFQLQALARHEKVMPAMVFLTLFAVAVSRWCKQHDLVIPFNVSGRHCHEQENMMGYFAHELLLRIELTGRESFHDVLRIVTQEFLTAWEHLDYGAMSSAAPDLAMGGASVQWISSTASELSGADTPPEWEEFDFHLKIETLPVKTVALDFSVEGESEADAGQIGMTFLNTDNGIGGFMYYRALTSDTVQRFSDDLCLIAEKFVNEPRVVATAFPTEIYPTGM